MCLGVPGKIIEVDGLKAEVDFWGLRKQIMLSALDENVNPGDYVLTHVGFAIRRIPQEEIAQTLAFYDAILKLGREDLMAQDVANEINATSVKVDV